MGVLDYPKYEIVFAVGEADDPIIQALQRDLPETQIRLIVGVEQLGVPQNQQPLPAREGSTLRALVMNDSDVRVVKDYRRAVTAPFRDAKVGVVTAFFRGITDSALASELDATCVPTEGAPRTPSSPNSWGRLITRSAGPWPSRSNGSRK